MELPGPGFPTTFSALSCDAPNVVPTAFYRETEDFSGKYLDDYAGKGMGYPFVVRLVEFDGIETEATLTIGGTVAKAFKTNFLGRALEALDPAKVKVHMRPYEIATVYLDIVEGRKQTRDLDAKREIWATVHRVDD
jgi:alpha-mannosidase